jgi:hypothetical protein
MREFLDITIQGDRRAQPAPRRLAGSDAATIGGRRSCVLRTPTVHCSVFCGPDCWISVIRPRTLPARGAAHSDGRRRAGDQPGMRGDAVAASDEPTTLSSRMIAIVREPRESNRAVTLLSQSSSASRLTAGTAGFFTLTQQSTRPDRAIPVPSIRSPRS